jgi:hypothetical protein
VVCVSEALREQTEKEEGSRSGKRPAFSELNSKLLHTHLTVMLPAIAICIASDKPMVCTRFLAQADLSTLYSVQSGSKAHPGPCHSSGGYSPASRRGGPGSTPGQVMWDLWWTKWHWGRFSPSAWVSPANSHFTDCSTIICHLGLVQ